MGRGFKDNPITSGLIAGFRMRDLKSRRRNEEIRLQMAIEDHQMRQRREQLSTALGEAQLNAANDADEFRVVQAVREQATAIAGSGKSIQKEKPGAKLGPPTDPNQFFRDEMLAVATDVAKREGVPEAGIPALASAATAAYKEELRGIQDAKAKTQAIEINNQIQAGERATVIQARGLTEAYLAASSQGDLIARILREREAKGIPKPGPTISEGLSERRNVLEARRLDVAEDEQQRLADREERLAQGDLAPSEQLKTLRSQASALDKKLLADDFYPFTDAGRTRRERDRLLRREVGVKLGELNVTLPTEVDYIASALSIKKVAELKDAFTATKPGKERDDALGQFLAEFQSTLKKIGAPQSLLDENKAKISEQKKPSKKKAAVNKLLKEEAPPADEFMLQVLNEDPSVSDEELTRRARELEKAAGG